MNHAFEEADLPLIRVRAACGHDSETLSAGGAPIYVVVNYFRAIYLTDSLLLPVVIHRVKTDILFCFDCRHIANMGIHSDFRLRNKRSIGALSQQLPRRLMLCIIRYRQSHWRNIRLAYQSCFYQVLKDREILISMDGKGSWHDNVFVERLWRLVKYEKVYLHAYDSVSAVKARLVRYFDFYNHQSPHSKLERLTPDQ